MDCMAVLRVRVMCQVLPVDLDLDFHAVTVFDDDLICAADSFNLDYGATTVMLMKTSKLQPSLQNAELIKDHLTNAPTILRVMHGGLQVRGQSNTFRTCFSTSSVSECVRD